MTSFRLLGTGYMWVGVLSQLRETWDKTPRLRLPRRLATRWYKATYGVLVVPYEANKVPMNRCWVCGTEEYLQVIVSEPLTKSSFAPMGTIGELPLVTPSAGLEFTPSSDLTDPRGQNEEAWFRQLLGFL